MEEELRKKQESEEEQVEYSSEEEVAALPEGIIKGRPFEVRFECLAQTSPRRRTLL